MDSGRALSSPTSFDGREGTRIRSYELSLLIRREEDDTFTFPDGCEDSACNAKICMVHVTALGCSGKAEGDPAILPRSHPEGDNQSIY